ncbi:putative histone acetyltransferase [Cunninghamella echinulata]|nr:putative histone acetyltransferase [Cunninghamella echinulata]
MEAMESNLTDYDSSNDGSINEETQHTDGETSTRGIKTEEDDILKLMEEHNVPPTRENPAMIEERNGEIEVKVVLNDGSRESMIYLTGLKNIFQKQLPMMPKEYIARLVYDRNHRSIALIRPPMKIIGGICYRPFNEQEFAEIVFCAIASTEQVKGYGSHLMNHLKDYVTTHTPMKHFLTYADNYATGYFRKQGFTAQITLDRRYWIGFIKDYEGGTIMQCTVVPKVKYLQAHNILAIQRQAVLEKTKQYSTSHIVYPGLDMPENEEGKRSIDPLSVPGVSESGWTPEMDSLSNRPRHPPHYNQMRHLVTELQAHASSWPFIEPVNADEVTDYYDVITEPMDLTTLEQNVEGDMYSTMDEFVTDVQKIFDNCRTYNAEGTNYARCANKLERYFKERLQVWSGSSN